MAGPLSAVGPWDLVAAEYYETTRPFLGQYARDAVQAVAVGPEHVVLDVATGPGTLCLELAAHAKALVAVDFSADMVEHCKRRKQELGLGHVEIIQGDGQALPLEADRFDRAFSNFGLMFFPDRLVGFRELLRTLKPGGRAAVTAWQPPENAPAFQLFMGAMQATGELPKQQPAPGAGLDDPAVFEAEMRAAGFRDVSVTPIVHSMRFDTKKTAWDEMKRGNAPIAPLQQKLASDWPQAEDKARRWVEEHVEPGRDYAAPAWLGVGTK